MDKKFILDTTTTQLDAVEKFCNEMSIRYIVWNADDIKQGHSDVATVGFDTRQDRNTVMEFIDRN